MLEYLKDSWTEPTKVTAYFSHSTMLLMMFTAFGNYYDPLPLLASNYDQQQNRQFKTNKISPYAANFAAVKYECSLSKPKILFLHNQQPLSMNWCKLGSICTIDEIRKFYENSAMKNCPCDICNKKFAMLSADYLPKSLLKSANLSCIPTNPTKSTSQINSSFIVPAIISQPLSAPLFLQSNSSKIINCSIADTSQPISAPLFLQSNSSKILNSSTTDTTSSL